MSNNTNKIAVIIFGPPGSGKGTQANLLADKLGLFQFDLGSYLRTVLFDPKNQDKKDIQRNRKLYESGQLCETAWIEKIVHKRVKDISKFGHSVVFSGNPRTIEEAFGKGENGLMHLLNKEYGKQNVYIFALEIPEAETVKRNSKRINCSVCGTPVLAKEKVKACPICGGKLIHRKDDKKEAILTRLKVYHAQTEPILNELRKQKYKLVMMDGIPAPYKIHEKILSYFK